MINKMKLIMLMFLMISIVACVPDGSSSESYSYWLEKKPPEGCVVKQIAGRAENIAILCEDGRVFT
jgi:hypothetical protein